MTTTKKKYNISSIPEAVIHRQLKLPSSMPPTMSGVKALREDIALQAQGEAVEVSEEYSIPLLMIAFDVVHKISPEMVLRLKSGKRILLFDHWGRPILRDKDIYAIHKITEPKNKKAFVSELSINLEDIWKTTKGKDDLETIKKALKEIEKLIKPAMVTTLVGKAPALLFLLTQHLLYGETGEIWYQENKASPSVRITHL